ncbi:MAG: THUMP domain-containing protein [Bacteroidota bacterium]
MLFTATTFAGMEEVLAQELVEIGASDIRTRRRAVMFRGDMQTMYRANLWLRTAIRVLHPIREFQIEDAQDLYDRVHDIDWTKYMTADQTLLVDPVVKSELFRHTVYPAQIAKDAIADQFRRLKGRRPSVDFARPDLRIHLWVRDRRVTVSLDSSGEPLFKRGYRQGEQHPAPINEGMAAGLIQLAKWEPEKPLVDPMCGSGTFSIEAAMIAANQAPGLGRKEYGFMKWASFSPDDWKALREDARAKIVRPEVKIEASDVSGSFVLMARKMARNAGVDGLIRIQARAFEKATAPKGTEPGWVFLNPPYENRLKTHDIEGFYHMMGQRLKESYPGYKAWIITANFPALSHLRMAAFQKYKVFNGGLQAQFRGYEVRAQS